MKISTSTVKSGPMGENFRKTRTRRWYGHSVGHWEGDTLVVESIGFNDKSWMDGAGHPHSEAMHVVERYRRVDHDTLELTMTIDDPKAYTKPWLSKSPKTFKLAPKVGPESGSHGTSLCARG